MYKPTWEHLSSWDEFVKNVDMFVENTLNHKGTRTSIFRKYNATDSEYLDALEELCPRLKEIRSRWS